MAKQGELYREPLPRLGEAMPAAGSLPDAGSQGYWSLARELTDPREKGLLAFQNAARVVGMLAEIQPATFTDMRAEYHNRWSAWLIDDCLHGWISQLEKSGLIRRAAGDQWWATCLWELDGGLTPEESLLCEGGGMNALVLSAIRSAKRSDRVKADGVVQEGDILDGLFAAFGTKPAVREFKAVLGKLRDAGLLSDRWPADVQDRSHDGELRLGPEAIGFRLYHAPEFAGEQPAATVETAAPDSPASTETAQPDPEAETYRVPAPHIKL